MVSVKIGEDEPFEKKWTLNQQNQNYLFEKYGEESNSWKEHQLTIGVVDKSGNDSIQITGVKE